MTLKKENEHVTLYINEVCLFLGSGVVELSSDRGIGKLNESETSRFEGGAMANAEYQTLNGRSEDKHLGQGG